MSERTIIQIIPCTHELFAIYKDGVGEWSTRVVCLALTETQDDLHHRYRDVIPMEMLSDGVHLVDESADDFVGYSHSTKPDSPL